MNDEQFYFVYPISFKIKDESHIKQKMNEVISFCVDLEKAYDNDNFTQANNITWCNYLVLNAGQKES